MQSLKKENIGLKSTLVAVKDQCLRTELNAKRKNLLIHGIPKKENENIEETVNDLLSEMSIRNYRDIKFTAIYRLRSKAKRHIRQNSRPASDPILVSVLNLRHKDRIMASVGNLRNTGKSVSIDLLFELAKRRKELLSTAYNLKNCKVASNKVVHSKVVQKGTRLWLESKNTPSSNWIKVDDACYDPLTLVFPSANTDFDSDA